MISFSGTDKQYKEVAFELAAALFSGIADDYFNNMVVTGTYTLEIDKNSFYIMLPSSIQK